MLDKRFPLWLSCLAGAMESIRTLADSQRISSIDLDDNLEAVRYRAVVLRAFGVLLIGCTARARSELQTVKRSREKRQHKRLRKFGTGDNQSTLTFREHG